MVRLRLSFLQSCLNSKVSSSFNSKRNKRANLLPGHKIKSAFKQNSIDKLSRDLIRLREGYYRLRLQFIGTLFFFDRLRFERYLSLVIETSRSRLFFLNDKRLRCLIFKKYGCFSDPNVNNMVLNLSSVEFSNLELTILAHGLDHSNPSRSIKREEMYSEFEVLFSQLRRLQPFSTNRVSDLNDLAHTYAGTPVSNRESNWRSEHFCPLKLLRSNNSLITRLDKSSGVVILDYQCYVNKKMSILGDTSKFLRLGPSDSFDHTTSNETTYQRRLVELVKKRLLSSAIPEQIRPPGSIRPCLYGLPMGYHLDLYYQWWALHSKKSPSDLTSYCNLCLYIIVHIV